MWNAVCRHIKGQEVEEEKENLPSEFSRIDSRTKEDSFMDDFDIVA